MDPEAIRDVFRKLGLIHIRRMFGGQGIYWRGQIFALEVRGEIYLKTDLENRPLFEAAGSRAFTFVRDGKPTDTSYWLLPGEASDDPAEAAQWARLALQAADRVAQAKPVGKRRRPAA